MITTFLAIVGGLLALLFGKSAMDKVALTQKKNEIGEAIVENHEVAAKVEAAQTDEEADAALKLDSDSDRH